MHCRTLGKTGFKVSEIGFGAWAIGADWGDTVPAEQAKRALSAAVEAGVNQVAPPQLSSSKSRDAYRDALDKAVEDARMNAERLAESLGMTLGDAIQVNAGSSVRPPIPMGRMEGMAMSDAAPQTYNAGDLTVTANINVVFETSP